MPRPRRQTLKWIIAAGRRRGRRVLRLPVLAGRSSPRCRRGSRRATAGSRRSSSTSPPRSRCGSRRSSSTRATSSSPARCWCGWTPSRWRRSWPRPTRASPPRRSSWRSPTPPSSSRRARSSSPRSRSTASRKLRRGERRLAAGARRPQDEAGDDHGRPRRKREAMLQTAKQQVEVAQANAATIQTRIDDATLKSRRSPDGCSIAWPKPARSSRAGGKALTLVNLEDVYMEIFLPSEQAAAREDRRRGAHHRRLRPRPRGRRLRQLRLPGGAVHAQAGRDAERAREADVPRQDPGAQGAGEPVHRAHQDGRPRRRLRQGEATPPSGRPGCRTSWRPDRPARSQRERRLERSSHGVIRVCRESPAGPAGKPVVSIKDVTHRYGKRRGARRHLARHPQRHHGRHHRPRRRRQVDAHGPDRRLQEDAAGEGDRPRRRHRPTPGIGAPSARGSPTCPRAWARTSIWSSASTTTSTSWRGSSGCPPRSARSASRSCSTPPGSARSPTAPPASSRAA